MFANGKFIVDEEQVPLKNITVIYADKPGVNKNIYPYEELEKALNFYNELIKSDPTRRYIFAKHPKDESEEWIGLIAGIIDFIWLDPETRSMKADITLLPTVWGNFVAWLIKNGYYVGVSIRGKTKAKDGKYELPNGETINVKYRYDIFFEGFDIVVFPSYITTNISLENMPMISNEKSKEQTIKIPSSFNENINDILCDVYGICSCVLDYQNILSSVKESVQNEICFENIYEQFKKENNINEELKNINHSYKQEEKTMNMEKIEFEKLQVAREKTELELLRLNNDIEEKKKEISALEETLASIKEQISSTSEELNKKEALLSVYKDYEEKIKEFEQQKTEIENELAAKKEELENVKERIDMSKVTVKVGNKVYSLDDPPKLIIVEPSEEVSNKPWGKVDKDNVRKLVYLSQDADIAKKVFGIVEDGWKEDYRKLKYPVYDYVNSEKGVKLLLNRDALATAVAFLFGRAGMGISAAKRTKVLKFIKSKYNELIDAGIVDELPEKLQNIKEKIVAINSNEPLVKAIIEEVLLRDYLDISFDDEETFEKYALDVDENIFIDNLTEAIIASLNGRRLDNAAEQTTNEEEEENKLIEKEVFTLDDLDADSEKFINMALFQGLSGEGEKLTSFAKEFNLATREDLLNFINSMKNSFLHDDIPTAIKQIQMLIKPVINKQIQMGEELNEAIDKTFIILSYLISNKKPINNEEGEKDIENNEEENSEEENLNKTNEKSNGGNDMVTTKIKDLITDAFDVEIKDEDALVKVVEHIIDSYVTTYAEYNALALDLAKRDAREMLSGIPEEEIETAFEMAESAEDIPAIVEELQKKYSSNEKEIDEEVKEKSSNENVDDGFLKILNSI